MKNNLRLIIYTIILGGLLFSCSNRTKSNLLLDKELKSLLISKKYFSLNKKLENAKNKLSEDRFLYYQAHCLDVFNESELSLECINELLTNYEERLNDTIIVDLLEIQSRNYGRMLQYKNVIEASHLLLGKYVDLLDSTKVEHYKENIELYGKIAELKPTTIHKEGDTKIKSSRNQFMNLVTVPVISGGQSTDFLFDTGAEMSCISMSKAKQMGMTIYDTDISIKTSSFAVKASLAVADSLYIGNVLFEHVLLLVMPIINIPEFDFLISGIIGIPEMRLMEEVHIKKDGSIFIPKKVKETSLKNMFYEGLSGVYPFVMLNSRTDTLNMAFDYGATESYLSVTYLNEHKQEIEEKGEFSEILVYGLGGGEKVKNYKLKDFSYKIEKKESILPIISVRNGATDKGEFDGFIGQDMLLPFEQIKINFKNMYLEIE
jgi:predicted aspartyl protease